MSLQARLRLIGAGVVQIGDLLLGQRRLGVEVAHVEGRWMSCLTPGPALVMTRIVPGMPPLARRADADPARPLTINCRLSASHQIVRFRASNSSRVRNSWARSQISGGSVTCASQSKVAKSLVIGANVEPAWCFLLDRVATGFRRRISPPASPAAPSRLVAGEDGVDLGHVRGRDRDQPSAPRFPPPRRGGGTRPAPVLTAGWLERPAQRELRQTLAVLGGQRLQFLDRARGCAGNARGRTGCGTA